MEVEVTRLDTDVAAVGREASVSELPRSQSLRGFDWRRAAVTFAATLVILVVIGGAAAMAYERMHSDRVLPGVSVAGVEVGGLSRAEAESRIRAGLPDLSDGQLTVRLGDRTETITYAAVGRDYDMDAILDSAFGVGRGAGILEQLQTLTSGVTVPFHITWDHDELTDRVNAIVAGVEADPVDATLSRTGAAYTVTPSEQGWLVDEQALYEQASAVIADTTRTSATISVDPVAVAPGLTTEEVQVAVEEYEATVAAPLTFRAGDQTVTVPSSVLRGWVRLEPAGEAGQWTVVVESAPISQIVDELAFRVNVEAVNASYTFERNQPTVIPAVDGLSLDSSAAVSAITESLNARTTAGPGAPLNFSLASVPAEFSTEDAAGLAGRVERLGRWVTHYRPSPFNGDGKNIRNPAKLINGTVVQPGEQFDFIDHAGPFTKRNGYADGAAIINGKTQIDGVLGGGLCSASTTLFNAAMRAGLQIDARHNHSYFINRYPVGLDATIWVNGNIRKTLAFTNDTPYPILIVAKNATTKVTFEIWGVSDGRTVDLSKAEVERKKKADTFMLYTDDLLPGQTLQTEFEAMGFDSTVVRVVKDADGNVLHENTWYSDYARVNGIIKVGRGTGDPRAGTKIPYAEWKAAQNGQAAPTE